VRVLVGVQAFISSLSGGICSAGGVHDFADELFEDVFECNQAAGLAVVVDQAGKVGAAAAQGCERGLQGGGGRDVSQWADAAAGPAAGSERPGRFLRRRPSGCSR
jgi:hypothetical protein